MVLHAAPVASAGSRSRALPWLAAAVLLLNLLVFGIASYTLHLSREQYQARAFVTTGNIAQVLEHDVTAFFDKIDIVVMGIKEEAESQLADGGLRTAALDRLMQRQLFRLPELESLRIADAKGNLIYGARGLRAGQVNIADRDYFRRLRDDPAATMVVSSPLVSRITGKWSVFLGRRLDLPDGTFVGIVYAAIDVDHLRQIFASLDLGPNGAVTLRDLDLRLVGRQPLLPDGKAAIGSQVVSQELRDALQARPEGGHFLATTRMDNVERANSYRRIEKYPFYILVGQSTGDLLQTWRVEAVKTGTLALAFALASILLAWQTHRVWRQREAEVAALARQEKRLRDLLDATPEALLIVDRDARITMVNAQSEVLFGRPRDELSGVPVEHLLVSLEDCVEANSTTPGRLRSGDGWVLDGDGRKTPVLLSVNPLETDQGTLEIVAVRDMTERLRAEHSLRESEERYRLVVEGVQDYAIFMLSPNGVVMNWNTGAQRIKQWSAEEIVGRHFSLCYTPEQVADGLPEQHLHTAAGGGSVKVEQECVRKDGSRFWAAVLIAGIRDSSGRLVGFARLTRDITERKRNELRERARSAVLDMIVSGAPLPSLLEAVINGLEQQLPSVRCLILLNDVFGTRLIRAAASRSLEGWTCSLEGIEADAVAGGLAGRSSGVLFRPAGSAADGDVVGHGEANRLEPLRGEHGGLLGVLVADMDPSGPPGPPPEFMHSVLEHAAKLASIAVERSRGSEALRLAASVYQAIGEAILVVGPDTRILAVNPAFIRLTGYPPAELLGLDPRVLSSGRQDRAFYQRMWHSIETTGRWQGEISLRHKDGHELSQWLMISTAFDEDGRVERRIGLYSEITDQKRAEELIWRHAHYDPLTLLPNRRLFQDRLEQEIRRARREGHSVAVLLIDLDFFKEVNDRLGHEAGDLLLIDAAKRIRNCVRDADTVARLGGDEFVVVLPGVKDVTRVRRVAEAIVSSLAEPFAIVGEAVRVAGSVGVALFPDDADDSGEIVRNADRAMYAAKQAGRGTCRFVAEAAPPAAS